MKAGIEPSLAIGDTFPHEVRTGRVAEWFKAPVLKTGVPARVPWVRIPPLPPPAFASARRAAMKVGCRAIAAKQRRRAGSNFLPLLGQISNCLVRRPRHRTY